MKKLTTKKPTRTADNRAFRTAVKKVATKKLATTKTVKPAKTAVKPLAKIIKPAKVAAKPATQVGPRIVRREITAVPATKKTEAVPASFVWEFRLGGLAAPIDPKDLCLTLGSGKHGNGRGLMDKWPAEMWQAVLKHLGLPSEPLNRVAAAYPVRRVVQKAWMEAFDPTTLKNAADKFATRDVEAAEAYRKAFVNVEAGAVVKAGAVKKARETKGETSYQPTEKLKKMKAPGGQAATLFAFFKATKWEAVTTRGAAEGMVKHGLKTSTKPERISAYYLCQWLKQGLLTKGGLK